MSVQSGAGAGTGFSDDEYRRAGVRVVDADRVWDSEIVVKVKELQERDFSRTVPGQAVFGYHHLVGHPDHGRRLFATGNHGDRVRGCSRCEWRLSAAGADVDHRWTNGGTRCCARPRSPSPQCRGPRCRACRQFSGRCGGASAGAQVTQLRRATATAQAVEDAALQADLVVGAAFTAGQRTPKLLSRSLVARMKRGSMIVDISIEEGGVAETSRATSHAEPTYVEERVIHYAVPNIPSAVPREAAEAISAAVIPYARALASKGIARALLEDASLRAGVLVWKGRCTKASRRRQALPTFPSRTWNCRDAPKVRNGDHRRWKTDAGC